MTPEERTQLVRLVRRSDADLAEAALRCARICAPELDVPAELLRVDALADQLRTGDTPLTTPREAAEALREHLAVTAGFHGEPARFHDPDSSLLHRVLDTRQGLPITLSVVYVAVARRLRVPAYPIALPGHVVIGIANGDQPLVLDPYHGGVILAEPELVERVAAATGGRLTFRRSMLRPTPGVQLVRRLLNNLTRDLTAHGRLAEAVGTVEAKLALPNHVAEDHTELGRLHRDIGRFDLAAVAFERFLELTTGDTPDREAARRAAIDARARLN